MNILSEGLATSQKNGKRPRGSRDPRLKTNVLRPRLARKPDLLSHVGQKASVSKKINCGLAFFLAAAVDCSTFCFHYEKVNVSHNILKN